MILGSQTPWPWRSRCLPSPKPTLAHCSPSLPCRVSFVWFPSALRAPPSLPAMYVVNVHSAHGLSSHSSWLTVRQPPL